MQIIANYHGAETNKNLRKIADLKKVRVRDTVCGERHDEIRKRNPERWAGGLEEGKSRVIRALIQIVNIPASNRPPLVYIHAAFLFAISLFPLLQEQTRHEQASAH